jgi:hypothetical protein
VDAETVHVAVVLGDADVVEKEREVTSGWAEEVEDSPELLQQLLTGQHLEG